jgi:hypothetical protein
VESPAEYATVLRDLFGALRSSTELAGFCYTQLLDTGQETNGLLYADATPKIPISTIYGIVTGHDEADEDEAVSSTFGWAD